MLRNPEVRQSLTKLPGIPGWPLFPGAPCSEDKERIKVMIKAIWQTNMHSHIK